MVAEQARDLGVDAKKKSGSKQVEEFCLEDPEEAESDEGSEDQGEDMRSSASQGRWG